MFSEFRVVACVKVSLVKVTKILFKKKRKYRFTEVLTVHLQLFSKHFSQDEGYRLCHNFASVIIIVKSVWFSLGPSGDVLSPDVSYPSFSAITREQNDPVIPSTGCIDTLRLHDSCTISACCDDGCDYGTRLTCHGSLFMGRCSDVPISHAGSLSH